MFYLSCVLSCQSRSFLLYRTTTAAADGDKLNTNVRVEQVFVVTLVLGQLSRLKIAEREIALFLAELSLFSPCGCKSSFSLIEKGLND